MSIKILINYSILLICIAGFSCGGVLALVLPAFQLGICLFNYRYGRDWLIVLILQIHLWISTALGLYLEGYLYLRYISNDAESVMVFRAIWKIGTVLVCGMGILTTLLKYSLTRNRNTN